MFHVNRWAGVFINVLGENAEEGLGCLKAIIPSVKAIQSALFGYYTALRLGKILRECVAGFSETDGGPGKATEYVIRFIVLLVQKNHFGEIDSVMRRIEERIDEQKGILTVIAESAALPDGAFEEKLQRDLAGRLEAREIKLKTRLVPDLLGGYRLRIGGFYVDASLKGQLEKMKADLEAAVLESAPGGGI